MIQFKHFNKFIAILLALLFVFQAELFLNAQGSSELNAQFNRACSLYRNGQYDMALKRLERIVGVIQERELNHKYILGQCYLLLGAINEKEDKPKLAVEYYKRARDECHVIGIDCVDISDLNLYRITLLATNNIKPGEETGVIEKPGEKKKKKFPWVWVAVGVVAVGVIYFLFLKPKKKYQLAVSVSEGVSGTPAYGIYEYKKNTRVQYDFRAEIGYDTPNVLLDGESVDPSGTIVMNGNHVLSASTSEILKRFIIEPPDRNITINQGQTTSFGIKLSGPPTNLVTVNVQKNSGSNDISIDSSNTLTFDTANYDTLQEVVLRAAPNSQGEEASFIVSADNIDPQYIFVRVETSDKLSIRPHADDLDAPEGRSIRLRVNLSANPGKDVNVQATITGDNDIFIASGAQLLFNSENWNTYQDIVIGAGEDDDTSNGSAVVTLSADDPEIEDETIEIREIDNDSVNFVTNTNEITVDEGGNNTFNVRLSSQPDSTITVNIIHISGDEDITVQSGSPMIFTENNWDIPQTVTLAAAEDDDVEDGSARIRIRSDQVTEPKDIIAEENDNDAQTIIPSVTQITVPEDGEASFEVTLAAAPTGNVTVIVSPRDSPMDDEDISIKSGETLIFTKDNYQTPQIVTLEAGVDEDGDNGSAVFQLQSDDVETVNVTATEDDNTTGLPPEVSISHPIDGTTVSTDIAIRALANDDFGVERVEFYIDDVLKGTDKTSYYEYVWCIGEYKNGGPYNIKAIAYDFGGNSSEPAEINVYVENALPAVSFVSPQHQQAVSETVAVVLDLADDHGLKEVELFFDNSSVESRNLNGETSIAIVIDFNTTLYSNGSHVLRAVVKDAADQESQQEIQIIISN